jgi:PAS domain S-box-containing protein
MGKLLRALIIEDSKDDAELLLRDLRRSGYEVEFERVETAEALQVVLTETTWDVILSDYYLPQFDALRALNMMQSLGVDIPFIIISGAIGEETAVAALKAGAHDFLVKGNIVKLRPTIERELHEAEERRRTAQATQTSEELFGSAFRHSPVGVCITGLDGRLQMVSESLLDMLGFTREELEGKHFNEITHPDDLEIGKEAVSRMMSGRIPSTSFEKRYFHKTGKPIWALVSSSLLRDASGQPVHFLTHILNMTERKQVEEAVKESEQRLFGIIDSAMDAIITIDEQQRITLFNPAAEQIFQHSASVVIGQPLDMLLPERFRSIHREHVHRFGKTEITRRTMGKLGVLSGLRANGEEFPFEASISQLEVGGQTFYTVILRDISERQRAEAAVLESEARYQNILDAMMEGCQIIDFEWRYVYVNEVVAAQGKHTREELVNHTMMEIYPGIESTELFTVLRQCMEQRIPKRLESQFVFPDDSKGWFELSIQPAREGIFILSTDITERKRAEQLLHSKNEELKAMSQQLWQAAKLATMGELAASIAHELNNPLATVSLRSEMLTAQYSPDDPQLKSLQIIDSEVKRMSSLVSNLLQFSRHGSSQISTIKVNEELRNTLELIQYHLRKYNILTVQELSSELPLIQADRQQLRQVFLNLFTNAADAMPLGGMLTIRTWTGKKAEAGITAPLRASAPTSLGLPISDTPQVFIDVSDTGEGIPADRLDRVWEPFYTTKPEGKGTGLGLAICRRIIQEHGGSIELISEGIPGRGTTFRLSLPAVKGL